MKEKTKGKNIKNIFLKGFFVILPIGLTVFLLIYLFEFFDNLLRSFVIRFIGIDIPGLGFAILISAIFLVGLFVSNVIGHRINRLIENLLKNTPIVKRFYTPIKEVMKSLSGEDRVGSFRKVVSVEFPMADTYSIGFVTNEDIVFDGSMRDAIFIPTTPNPTNGFLVYKSKEAYKVLNIPVDEAVKMVVSLGTVSAVEIMAASRETSLKK